MGPHTSDAAAQFPGACVTPVVMEVVDVVATEVLVVAPVPFELVVLVLVVELVVLVTGVSGPSQLLETFTSAQFQNCSGTPLPSGGRGWLHTGMLPG